MKKALAFILVLVGCLSALLAAVPSYSTFLYESATAISMALGEGSRVAIVGFDSDSPNFSSTLIGDLERILMSKGYTLPNRTSIDKVIAELKLQASGLVDERTAISIGNIVGADKILTGKSMDIGSFYHVEFDLIDVESSLTLRKVSYNLPYDQELAALVGKVGDFKEKSKNSYGIKVGTQFGVTESFDAETEGKTPVLISAAVSRKLSDAINGEIGITYGMGNGAEVKGIQDGSTIYDLDFSFSTISIPALLSLAVLEDPFVVAIQAGASLNIPFGGSQADGYNHNTSSRFDGYLNIEDYTITPFGGVDVGIPLDDGTLSFTVRAFGCIGSYRVRGTIGTLDVDGYIKPVTGTTFAIGYWF